MSLLNAFSLLFFNTCSPSKPTQPGSRILAHLQGDSPDDRSDLAKISLPGTACPRLRSGAALFYLLLQKEEPRVKRQILVPRR
jgi:hypothetical protein